MDKTKTLAAEEIVIKYLGIHAHCSDVLSGGMPDTHRHFCASPERSWVHDEPFESKNTAGQTILCGTSVATTLMLMEEKLKKAFKQAAKPLSTKDAFLQLATEIEEDLQKLSPAFKIVSGGKRGCGTERYEMIVKKEWTGVLKREYTTLPQAVRMFKKGR